MQDEKSSFNESAYLQNGISVGSVLTLVLTLVFIRCQSAKKSSSERRKTDLLLTMRSNTHRLGLFVQLVEDDSIYEAISDQLQLHNPRGTYTSAIIKKQAEAYLKRNSAETSAPCDGTGVAERENRKYVGTLHAIANAYKRTIEVVHGDRIESTTIRPLDVPAKSPVQTLYIGYGGYDRFFSLRPENEQRSGHCTKDKRNATTENDESSPNILIGDNCNQYVILPSTGNDDEKRVTKNIVVGKGNTQNIVATFRTPNQLLDFMTKNKAIGPIGSDYQLRLKIRQESKTLTEDEVKQREKRIIELLQDEDSETRRELDEELKKIEMSYVSAKLECVLLQLMPNSEKGLHNFVKLFMRGDLECVIKLLTFTQDKITQVPSHIDVQLQIQIKVTNSEKSLLFNLGNDSEENGNKRELTQSKTREMSTGISLVLRHTVNESSASAFPPIDISEDIAKISLNCIEKTGLLGDTYHIEARLEKFCSRGSPSCRLAVLDNAYNTISENVQGCIGVILCNNDVAGNCFRIGTKFIMTARHVIKAIDRNTFTNCDEDNAVVVKFPDVNEEYRSRVVFQNKEMDVAILELNVTNAVCRSLTDVVDCYCGFPFFSVGYPYPLTAREAKRSVIVCADYTTTLSSLHMVLFESESFDRGSSGAPGLAIIDGKVNVVTMLLGTLISETDVWYYGVKMFDVFQLLQKERPDIAKHMICRSQYSHKTKACHIERAIEVDHLCGVGSS